jgi:phosphatidylglycerol:prolipoprotein diacylglycerol transferase
MDTELASRITFNAAIWGVIGARALSLIEESEHLGDSAGQIVETLLLKGGLTWYGGLATGAAATIYTIVKARTPIIPVLDAMSPAALVGYAFGRAGCLFSGDGCYGIATGLPWGMQFPKLEQTPGFNCMQAGAIADWPPVDPSTCTDPGDLSTCLRYPPEVHVHPTPIYEVLASLGCFAALWIFRKRIQRTGLMLGLFFILNGVPRFFVEFIRLNPRYLGLSLSQWLAIGLLCGGSYLIWRSFRLPEAMEAAAVEEKPAGRRRRRK